jgi:hypothetical protein
LLFDFARTTDNKWFLNSVEGIDSSSSELSEWLKTKRNLKIQVQ